MAAEERTQRSQLELRIAADGGSRLAERDASAPAARPPAAVEPHGMPPPLPRAPPAPAEQPPSPAPPAESGAHADGAPRKRGLAGWVDGHVRYFDGMALLESLVAIVSAILVWIGLWDLVRRSRRARLCAACVRAAVGGRARSHPGDVHALAHARRGRTHARSLSALPRALASPPARVSPSAPSGPSARALAPPPHHQRR
jgi:hypothetical protein